MLREFTRLLFLPAPYAAAFMMTLYRSMAGKDSSLWKMLLWGAKLKAGLFLLLSVLVALGAVGALLSGTENIVEGVVLSAFSVYLHLLVALVFWLIASRIEKLKP